MGIKFLRLQMIPWCFHMGNHVTCLHFPPDQPVGTIKLIKSDGLVKIYHRPINVSQLMLEFPKHLVCHSDSFYIGQKIPALSEGDELKLGHKYFLLPKHFFQSVLSFVTIASFASSQSQAQVPSPLPSSSSSSSAMRASNSAFLKKVTSCQPFDIQKTPSGSLQIRVSDEFISKLMVEGRITEEEKDQDDTSSSKPKSKVCTTAQLQKDYTQLVGCRQWKPKLEPIRESETRKLSSFGMKRSKKSSQSKEIRKIQGPEQYLHVNPTTTPPPKTKIKTKTKTKAKKGKKGL